MARLLIHEPDPTSLAVNAAQLRAHGFMIEEEPALEALRRRLATTLPDILLVGDVRLSGNGAAALIASGGVQTVAYGPACDPCVMNLARELGASGFFQAPLDAEVVAPRLRRLLNDRRVVWIDDLSAATAPLAGRSRSQPAAAIAIPLPAPAIAVPIDAVESAFAGLNPTIASLAVEHGAATVELLLAALQKQLAGLNAHATATGDLGESARSLGDAAACLGFTSVRDACFELGDACAEGDDVEPKRVRAAALCANVRARIQTCLLQAA